MILLLETLNKVAIHAINTKSSRPRKMFNTTLSESALISRNNVTNVPESDMDNNERAIARVIHVVVRPLLVLFGTTGNILSFLVMRRGSLKTVSTCFYKSILALADTGTKY